ncbi:hypothetical protein PFISCL1PPCAC_17480, partial [Pristionchus fissidentatus]
AVFVISAMQLVMEDRKRDKTIGSLLAECCTLLNISFAHLDKMEESAPSISWAIVQSELAVVATTLMSRRGGKEGDKLDSLSVSVALETLKRLVDYSSGIVPSMLTPQNTGIIQISRVAYLSSSSALPTYGVLLAAALEVYGSEHWTSEIRLAALALVRKLSEESAAESLACMIPGVLTALHSLLTSSTTTTNLQLLQRSLEVYGRSLACVYTLKGEKKEKEKEEEEEKVNDSIPPSPPQSSLVVDRNEEWWSTLEERAVASITQIAAVLASHRSADVRLKLLSTVATVWGLIDKDQSILDPTTLVDRAVQDKLQGVVIDLLLVLSEDADERISSNCAALLIAIPSNALIDSCHEKLAEFASFLPVTVRNGDGDKQLFAKVSSVIRVLDKEIVFLAETEDEMLERFVRSLVDCIRFDAPRLSIVSGDERGKEEKE